MCLYERVERKRIQLYTSRKFGGASETVELPVLFFLNIFFLLILFLCICMCMWCTRTGERIYRRFVLHIARAIEVIYFLSRNILNENKCGVVEFCGEIKDDSTSIC